jgi:hypothetical protein
MDFFFTIDVKNNVAACPSKCSDCPKNGNNNVTHKSSYRQTLCKSLKSLLQEPADRSCLLTLPKDTATADVLVPMYLYIVFGFVVSKLCANGEEMCWHECKTKSPHKDISDIVGHWTIIILVVVHWHRGWRHRHGRRSVSRLLLLRHRLSWHRFLRLIKRVHNF